MIIADFAHFLDIIMCSYMATFTALVFSILLYNAVAATAAKRFIILSLPGQDQRYFGLMTTCRHRPGFRDERHASHCHLALTSIYVDDTPAATFPRRLLTP